MDEILRPRVLTETEIEILRTGGWGSRDISKPATSHEELRARLESAHALLRELAAPARLAALERLIRIARLALSWGMADKDDCPNEFGADVNEAAALLDVLRRAEAEVGEETK